MAEVTYKVRFMEKYYNTKFCDFDINYADVVVHGKRGRVVLYIESKDIIANETEKRRALAQAVLTNKKQKAPLSRCAIIFADKDGNDNLIEIDCSDNSILYNNDINWEKEKPSNPTADAVDRINDRISGRMTNYKKSEISEYFKNLVKGNETKIKITANNFTVIYNQWKNEVQFDKEISNEQDLITLYIVDMLNGSKYEEEEKMRLFPVGYKFDGTEIDSYEIENLDGGKKIRFLYDGIKRQGIWKVKDVKKYSEFWQKYIRPPEAEEFKGILEQSAKLYSDKYRSTTGGEYTPHCFVKLQNEKLAALGYNMDDYIVFDPCCGVGNLQNDFGWEYKDSCYMSTLEQMDVDICHMKGFENVVQFDFLKDDKFPQFKYKGRNMDILEICRLEQKKLMVIMNPPYKRVKGAKYNLAIKFFNKCVKLAPQIIVFYYMTESFLRKEIQFYIDSGYKIQSHVISNAKTTFKLSEWSISQVIFSVDKGVEIDRNKIEVERYEYDKNTDGLYYVKKYAYNTMKPDLITNEIEKLFSVGNSKQNVLGRYCYLQGSLYVGNIGEFGKQIVTADNIKYCLLSKGLCFNTHHKYYERNEHMYRGKYENIPKELYADAIMFSLFYIHFGFTNKNGHVNYIMPYTARELGCSKNDLNVLINTKDATGKIELFCNEPFDFRDFMAQFDFSQEAKDLYDAALKIFLYYHANPKYENKDWNDSFYDITNAIMGKSGTFVELGAENDKRINKVKTTKGTKGFGRKTIKYVVLEKDLPIFNDFFDKRDILAKKINRQLVDSGLLLWERENIY